jgi:hypothetical protein
MQEQFLSCFPTGGLKNKKESSFTLASAPAGMPSGSCTVGCNVAKLQPISRFVVCRIVNMSGLCEKGKFMIANFFLLPLLYFVAVVSLSCYFVVI